MSYLCLVWSYSQELRKQPLLQTQGSHLGLWIFAWKIFISKQYALSINCMLMFMIFTAMFTVSTYLATYTIYIDYISIKNVLPILTYIFFNLFQRCNRIISCPPFPADTRTWVDGDRISIAYRTSIILSL